MSVPPFIDLPERVGAGRVTTARGTFAVLDTAAGRAAPYAGTALLVPGLAGSKEDFIGVLAPLGACGYRVVALDQRGQYESPGTPEPCAYTLHALAEDVLAVAAALGDGPVHLLGHAFGGHVCREAALASPEHVRSLALVGCGPAALSAAETVRARLLVEALPVTGPETIWSAMRTLDQAAGVVPPPDSPIAAFLHRRFVTSHPASLSGMGRALVEAADRVAELSALPLPILVLRGATDHAWPVEWQDAMARRLGAVRAIVSGAAHSPAAERPSETARALADFWALP